MPTTQLPTAHITRRSETLTVTVDVELEGFGLLPFAGGGSKLTPSSARMTVTHGPRGNQVEVHVRGANDYNRARTGRWSSPYRTHAPGFDPSDPLVGYVADIPKPVRDALEEATGISFADYDPVGD